MLAHGFNLFGIVCRFDHKSEFATTETPEEQPPPEEDGIIRIDLRGS